MTSRRQIDTPNGYPRGAPDLSPLDSLQDRPGFRAYIFFLGPNHEFELRVETDVDRLDRGLCEAHRGGTSGLSYFNLPRAPVKEAAR